MPTAETEQPTVTAPHIGRQFRMGQEEYTALTKAAARGRQNGYILKALRNQLSRDGFLAKNGTSPSRKLSRKKR